MFRRLGAVLQQQDAIARPDEEIGVTAAFGINRQHAGIGSIPATGDFVVVVARGLVFGRRPGLWRIVQLGPETPLHVFGNGGALLLSFELFKGLALARS